MCRDAKDPLFLASEILGEAIEHFPDDPALQARLRACLGSLAAIGDSVCGREPPSTPPVASPRQLDVDRPVRRPGDDALSHELASRALPVVSGDSLASACPSCFPHSREVKRAGRDTAIKNILSQRGA